MAPRKTKPAATTAAPLPATGSSRKKSSGPTNQYDAVNASSGKKRRRPVIETAGETGKNSRQLPPLKRLAALALVRDSIRNFSNARSILRQMALNVVGTKYKVIIKHPELKGLSKDAKQDHPVTRAQNWFNTVWAKSPDFRNDNHLFDVNRLLLSAVVQDGDVGMLFDRDFLKTGKIITFESDQICDPEPLPAGVISSEDGVLKDQYGREVGFFTHFQRGKASAKLAEGHVFPRNLEDPSENMFRLLRMPWRPNQGRGISELFTSVADLLDIYEMRAKELQSAKVTASFGMAVEKNPDEGPIISDRRLDPDLSDEDAEAEEIEEAEESENYERLEALAGGYFEYLKKGEKISSISANRPNLDGIPFSEFIIRSAGSSIGMARCYATMQAQTSYTAFRGEMIMTWVMFYYWQKWVERYIQDWQVARAINWGNRENAFGNLPDDWHLYCAFAHPKMPSLNPLLDQQTFLAALKNGATNLEEELGPGWLGIVEELIAEVEFMREAGLPHAMFETVAGAPIADPDKD